MGGLPTNRTVNGFAVDPANPKIMYVAMRDGLFKSTDAGDSWKQVGSELKNLASATVNVTSPSKLDNVVVTTVDGGVWVRALFRRLITTWCNWSESPSTVMGSAGTVAGFVVLVVALLVPAFWLRWTASRRPIIHVRFVFAVSAPSSRARLCGGFVAPKGGSP